MKKEALNELLGLISNVLREYEFIFIIYYRSDKRYKKYIIKI